MPDMVKLNAAPSNRERNALVLQPFRPVIA